MARDYNEQAPDGSWRHVIQHDNGTFTVTPIAPSGYQAAGISGGGGGGQTYSTQNGQLTLDQMLAGLDSAANGYWNGDRTNPYAVQAAYQQAPAGAGYGGGTSLNLSAADLAERQANDAVDAEIRRGQLDLAKLSQTWLQTYQTSLLTGTYNGQPTLAAQGQRNQEALGLLSLDASLAGRPANAFTYGRILTGTPGGLADIVRAAGGAYRLPTTGGGSGEPNQPLTIQSMINDIGNYSPSANPPPAAPPGTPPAAPSSSYQTKNGAKTLDQMRAELKVANPGGNYTDDATVLSTYASTTGGPVTPAGAPKDTTQQQTSYIPQTGPLPPANQWNPQNIQNMNPSQRDLLTADYGAQGWIPQDLNDLYLKSLKGYGGPARGAVGF